MHVHYIWKLLLEEGEEREETMSLISGDIQLVFLEEYPRYMGDWILLLLALHSAFI